MMYDNTCSMGTLCSMGTTYANLVRLGIMITSFALGFATVAVCVYKRNYDDIEELPYEYKYYDEFYDKESRELSKSELSNLATTFLRETTPNGDVIMSYNNETETFQYWCDDKNIKFMILDAVAQKYAIENDVKAICVDYKQEYEAGVEAAKIAQEKRNNTKEDETLDTSSNTQPNIFAKFKKYNMASEKTKVDARRNKISILTEKCNRFKRCGNIYDWETEWEIQEDLQEPELSITEWLKQQRTATSMPNKLSN